MGYGSSTSRHPQNSPGFPTGRCPTAWLQAAPRNGPRSWASWPNSLRIKRIRTRRWLPFISPPRTAVRTICALPYMRWSPTTHRARSWRPTSSPRLDNGWQARRSRWNRSARGGGNGHCVARPSRRIRRRWTLARTGSRIRPRRLCGWPMPFPTRIPPIRPAPTSSPSCRAR